MECRYSLVMAGEVHITTPASGLPDGLNSVRITGGRYGWLIAADTADVAAQGHVTEFPSEEKTVIAQFRVKCGSRRSTDCYTWDLVWQRIWWGCEGESGRELWCPADSA